MGPLGLEHASEPPAESAIPLERALAMTLIKDIGILAALALALLVVGVVDRATKVEDRDVTAPVTVLAPSPEPPPPPAPKPLRLAVTEPQYDDMGRLLRELGDGYPFDTVPLTDLEDLAKLERYDVVFLTCSGVPESWVTGAELGPGGRPGTRSREPDQNVIKRLRESLRGFVGKGGTLYASDWAMQVLQVTFPELFAADPADVGAAQAVEAEVVDPGLRELLGPSMRLNFDLDGWYPARLRAADATTYLQGEFTTNDGQRRSGPLLVKVPYEEGVIIFTSFHNEKNNGEAEKKLLRYLVFTVVTAQEVARVQETLVKGGFSPRKVGIFDVSTRQSITRVYQNPRAGALRFVLGFTARGARFRLDIQGPKGQKLGREGTETFTIEVPDAEPGDWSYTITAQVVPYPNFPYTLTIGQ